MRILMLASEAVPLAKTGGLADVAGTLPVELARLGHEVQLALPRYSGIEPKAADLRQTATVAGPFPRRSLPAGDLNPNPPKQDISVVWNRFASFLRTCGSLSPERTP